MKSKTAEWFNFASRDILAAAEIIDHPFLQNIAAFHCQQAVEKYLKAVLIENGQEVPRVHNLVWLLKLAKKYCELEFDDAAITLLNQVYSETRYPFEVGCLPDGKPEKEDTHQFYELAKTVEKRIKEVIS